jgi:hypothetical protein
MEGVKIQFKQDSIKDKIIEKKCFVLIFDLLGTNNKSSLALNDTLIFLYDQINAIVKFYEQKNKLFNKINLIEYVSIFQDTVIIAFEYSNSNNQKVHSSNIAFVIEFCQALFVKCLYMKIPIRGGLAHGDVVFYGNSIFGEPLKKLKPHFDNFQMLGIYLDDDLKDVIDEEDFSRNGLIFYPIIKANEPSFPKQFLNWCPGLYQYQAKTNNPFNSIDECFDFYFNRFEIPDLESIRRKYDNTKIFFKFCLENRPDLNKAFIQYQIP